MWCAWRHSPPHHALTSPCIHLWGLVWNPLHHLHNPSYTPACRPAPPLVPQILVFRGFGTEVRPAGLPAVPAAARPSSPLLLLPWAQHPTHAPHRCPFLLPVPQYYWVWIGLGAVLASIVINVVVFVLAATFMKVGSQSVSACLSGLHVCLFTTDKRIPHAADLVVPPWQTEQECELPAPPPPPPPPVPPATARAGPQEQAGDQPGGDGGAGHEPGAGGAAQPARVGGQGGQGGPGGGQAGAGAAAAAAWTLHCTPRLLRSPWSATTHAALHFTPTPPPAARPCPALQDIEAGAKRSASHKALSSLASLAHAPLAVVELELAEGGAKLAGGKEMRLTAASPKGSAAVTPVLPGAGSLGPAATVESSVRR